MASETPTRTSAGLRDILFDEIDALRKPKGNPQRALAVASLAKQIINTVEAEVRFHQAVGTLKEFGDSNQLGTMLLGSSSGTPTAASAASGATEA